MSGLIHYGRLMDEESEGTAYTYHITLVGETDPKEYAVYHTHTDGLIVQEFPAKSNKMFIPATAIKTISVEYN